MSQEGSRSNPLAHLGIEPGERIPIPTEGQREDDPPAKMSNILRAKSPVKLGSGHERNRRGFWNSENSRFNYY